MSKEEKIIHEHETFGMISISKVNSSGAKNIFGSDIKVRDFYELTIHQAMLERGITDDRYRTVGQPVLELNLTERQLNELLLNRNCGEGIPCSILFKENKGYLKNRPSIPTRKQALMELFKERINGFYKTLNLNKTEIGKLLGKNKLSKADKDYINSTLNRIEQELSKNLPYITETYLETLENVESETKAQILSLITRLKETGELPSGSKRQIKKLLE